MQVSMIGAALFVGAILVAGAAQAEPVTYTFSGDVTAHACTVCDGTDNTPLRGDFSLVINSNTSAVDVTDLPFTRLFNVSGNFSLDGFSDTLTDITLVANAGQVSPPFPANIQMFSGSGNMGLGFDDPSGLAGYELIDGIGPITADPADLSPTFLGGNFATAGGEELIFDTDSSLTFTAAVQGVPEPFTLSLFGAGLAGAAAIRRRKKAKQA